MMTPNKETLAEVIDYGFTLLPCNSDKKPKCAHNEDDWPKGAFSTLEAIEKDGSPMYAMRPAHRGLFCLDIDMKGESDGFVSLMTLCAEAGIDDIESIIDRHPCKVNTPSGGFHLYFKTDGMSASLTNGFHNHIVPGIDTRCGGNGYVIAPGSFNSKYNKVYDLRGSFTDCEPMPDKLIQVLTAKAVESFKKNKKKADPDDVLAGLGGFNEESVIGQYFSKAKAFLRGNLDKIVREYYPNAKIIGGEWKMHDWEGTAGTSVSITRSGPFLGVARDWKTYNGIPGTVPEAKNIFSMIAELKDITPMEAVEILTGYPVPVFEIATQKSRICATPEPEAVRVEKYDDPHRDKDGFSYFDHPVNPDIIPKKYIKKDKKGTVTIMKCNALYIDMLAVDDSFRKGLVFDEGTQRILFSSKFKSIDEAQAAIWRRFARYDFDVSESVLRKLCIDLTMRNRINTILDYYEALRPHYSPASPIDEMLSFFRFQKYGTRTSKYIPEDDPAILNIYRDTFARFFLCQCGRVQGYFKHNYPLPMDVVPVFSGRQGIGKGRFCRWLAMDVERYADLGNAKYSINDPNFIRSMQGKLVGELGEMSKMRAAEVDDVKAFVSGLYDEYTPKYREGSVKVPRVCALIASTNDDEFLRDKTGNRRFTPIWLDSIDPALFENKDLARRLWAHYWGIAEEAWKAGVPEVFFASTADQDALEAMRLGAMETTALEPVIMAKIKEMEKDQLAAWNSGSNRKKWLFLDKSDIQLALSKDYRVNNSTSSEIRAVLARFGYENRPVKVDGELIRKFTIAWDDSRLLRRANMLSKVETKQIETDLPDDDQVREHFGAAR